MERQSVFEAAPLLGITAQLFQSRMETLLAPIGLTYTQLAVLSHLNGQDRPQSISDLAAAFEIKQPGMSKVVKRLDEFDAVTTEVDPTDPRRKLVSITAEGRERFEAAGLALQDDVGRWFADWSNDEVAAFTSSLARLSGWLDQHRLDGD